jgi:hypothetical protein
LNFTIIVKQVVVLNLCDLVDSSFLRNVRRRGRPWKEIIGLNFAINLLWLILALLSQVVGQVYLNSGSWAGSKVVRGYLIFRFFEFNELLLYHFKFALLCLRLIPKVLSLSRRQLFFQNVHSVCISSEYTLVIHNVEVFVTWDLILILTGVFLVICSFVVVLFLVS